MALKISNEDFSWYFNKAGYQVVSRKDVLQVPRLSSDTPIIRDVYSLNSFVQETRFPKQTQRRLYFGKYAKNGAVECLVESEPARLVRRYEPLKRNGLFRKFANLQQTPEAIIGFANKYGGLGLPVPALEDHGRDPYIEPLGHWYSEIRDMALTLKIYDFADKGEVEKLHNMGLVAEQGRARDDELAGWVSYVSFHISGKLLGQVSAVLYSPPGLATANGGYPDGLVFKPHTLLAAMWLQFAFEIAGMRVRRICRGCHRPMWLDSERRSDSLYHDNTCKMKAYRRRRKQGNPGDTDSPA